MSYILDALRKAEADRKLGESVGVHDPAPMPTPASATQTSAWPAWWPVALAGMAALALSLFWLMRDEPSAMAEANQMAAAPKADSLANDTVAKADAWPNAAANEVVQIPQPAVQDRPMPAASAHATSKRADDGAQAASKPAAEPAIRLTPEIRSTLPALSVGGAMYSEVPTSRMVVINGQLFHEGDTVAPEVTLESIRLKSALIRYRGQRYVLDY